MSFDMKTRVSLSLDGREINPGIYQGSSPVTHFAVNEKMHLAYMLSNSDSDIHLVSTTLKIIKTVGQGKVSGLKISNSGVVSYVQDSIIHVEGSEMRIPAIRGFLEDYMIVGKKVYIKTHNGAFVYDGTRTRLDRVKAFYELGYGHIGLLNDRFMEVTNTESRIPNPLHEIPTKVYMNEFKGFVFTGRAMTVVTDETGRVLQTHPHPLVGLGANAIYLWDGDIKKVILNPEKITQESIVRAANGTTGDTTIPESSGALISYIILLMIVGGFLGTVFYCVRISKQKTQTDPPNPKPASNRLYVSQSKISRTPYQIIRP